MIFTKEDFASVNTLLLGFDGTWMVQGPCLPYIQTWYMLVYDNVWE